MLRGTRRIATIVVIIAIAIAAAIGIIAIVGGPGDETSWRVFGTALIVAGLGTIALIQLALLASVPRWFAAVVLVLAVLAAIGGIAITWGLVDVLNEAAYATHDYINESLLDLANWIARSVSVLAMFTGFAVVATLTLPARRAAHPVTRVTLIATLLLLTALPVIFAWLIFATPTVDEWFVRVIAVLAVLAALGIVATPVLAAVLHRPADAQSVGIEASRDEASSGDGVHLSTRATERIEQAAAVRGVTPDALVDGWLSVPPPSEPNTAASDPT